GGEDVITGLFHRGNRRRVALLQETTEVGEPQGPRFAAGQAAAAQKLDERSHRAGVKGAGLDDAQVPVEEKRFLVEVVAIDRLARAVPPLEVLQVRLGLHLPVAGALDQRAAYAEPGGVAEPP